MFEIEIEFWVYCKIVVSRREEIGVALTDAPMFGLLGNGGFGVCVYVC